jgi:CheY-like chemotaxis protein
MEAQQSNKVMLIEDDATMRSVLRTLLEIEGYEVTVVPEFRQETEVIENILKAIPDFLLLDVHLRNLSGIEIMQKLHNEPLMQRTRVIMTSGMDMKDQCLRAGASYFLMKPYMPDELIGMLK